MSEDNRQAPDFIFDPKRSERALKEEQIRNTDRQSGLVKAWSYSSLSDYEQCPHRVYLKRIVKAPEPPKPAADRGTTIHGLAESFVKGEISELPDELKHFADRFDQLRAGYAAGQVIVEDEWAFDSDWSPVPWFDDKVWARVKLDALMREDPSSGLLVDHKSGRKFGNEIKHSQQAQIYAVSTFMREPELEFLKIEFWYLDHASNNLLEKKYTRERALLFLDSLNQRATAMTTAVEFKPRPSKSTCKWCPYQQNDVCEWRVK